jgi:hypothetical protein
MLTREEARKLSYEHENRNDTTVDETYDSITTLVKG